MSLSKDWLTLKLTWCFARRHLGDKTLKVGWDEPLLVLWMRVVQGMVDHQSQVHHQLEQEEQVIVFYYQSKIAGRFFTTSLHSVQILMCVDNLL